MRLRRPSMHTKRGLQPVLWDSLVTPVLITKIQRKPASYISNFARSLAHASMTPQWKCPPVSGYRHIQGTLVRPQPGCLAEGPKGPPAVVPLW